MSDGGYECTTCFDHAAGKLEDRVEELEGALRELLRACDAEYLAGSRMRMSEQLSKAVNRAADVLEGTVSGSERVSTICGHDRVPDKR